MKRFILFVCFILFAVTGAFAQENGKSIIITGIDSKYIGIYSLFLCSYTDKNTEKSDIGVGCIFFGSKNPVLHNGILTSSLHNQNIHPNDKASNWTGTGQYYVVLNLLDGEGWSRYISKTKINFNNNYTVISFNDFNFTGLWQ